MTQDDFAKSLLALVMWREARGDGPEAMKAVGCVVRNRTNAGKDYAAVIIMKWQFSSMTATGDPELTLYPKSTDPTWQEAMLLAEGIYSGAIPDNTGGSTSYYATTIPAPKWTATMTFTTQIGNQRFFKCDT